MRLTLALAALALWVSAAAAQPTGQWLRVGEVTGGTFYIQPAAPQGGYLRYWERIDFSTRQQDTGDHSMISLMELDCAGQRSRTLEMIGYTGPALSGRAVPEQGSGRWTAITPGSIGHDAAQIVCEASSGGGGK